MANNVAATPGTGVTFKTTDNAGVHTGHVNVDSSALPSGAATSAKQPALGTAGSASTDVITVQGIASGTALAVSAASLPLPSGAATAAKQPALGTAGSSSTDVISVQGIASGTALPVTGTITAVTSLTNALPAGTNAIGKLAANSGVDIGDVDVTTVIPGTGATNLGKAEDAAHSSGDTGVMALAVRKDSAASFAGTDGDYAPLQLDANGALRITGAAAGTEYTEDAAAASDPAGGALILVRRDTLSASEVSADGDNVAAKATSKGELYTHDTDVLAAITGDDVAHDAADGSTKPVKIGAKAIAGLSSATLVAAADRTDLYAGLDGAQLTRPHCGLEDIVSGNANNTDGSSTSVITAAGAGVKQYLTSVILTNTSSSNIYVEMKSGTTVKATIPLPANSGAIFNPPVPLPPNAANEAWNFDPSAATSTVYCTAVGFKSKV